MGNLGLKLFMVASGGALGASGRFLIGEWLGRNSDRWLPAGTLLVNALGSLLIGYFLVLLPAQEYAQHPLRILLITGILGGFTTYSAFSAETLLLFQQGQTGRAVVYVITTLVLCLLCVWLGFLAGRLLH